MRRIGVLHCAGRDDPEARPHRGVPAERCTQLGWTDGRNVRIDIAGPRRCRPNSQTCGGIGRARAGCHSGYWHRDRGPLLQATRTMPIVFALVADPVGAGFVESLARPGGNATGFIMFEYSIEREMAGTAQGDRARRDASGRSRDPAITAGIGQFGAIQAVAPSLGLEVSPVNVRDAGEIERAVATFARSSNGGLIVTASALAAVHRELIIALAARHKLPAVYFTASSSPPAA